MAIWLFLVPGSVEVPVSVGARFGIQNLVRPQGP